MEITQKIIRETQQKALNCVREHSGLKHISIGDGWMLNVLVRDALERYTQIKDPRDEFSPAIEAAGKYCECYYEIPFFAKGGLYFTHRLREEAIMDGHDRFAEWMQKRHDEAHLI